MTLTQKTIKREIRCSGIGLHCGKQIELKLRPSPAGSGIRFRRTDTDAEPIPASLDCLNHTHFATQLSAHGSSVNTVEHLLSAASGLGVDNLLVEVDGEEIPIMDGSAAPFIYLMHEAGLRRQQAPRQFIKIIEPIRVGSDDKFIAVYPAERLKISYTIDFDHPLIGIQRETFVITPRVFMEQIAPARTFGFLKEVEWMRSQGLALGGSMENAVVVGENSVLNNRLRYPDEFVRHKILDAIGDLALLGLPLLGHVVAYRAGHRLHTDLVSAIREAPEAWRAVSWEEIAREAPAARPEVVTAIS